MGSITRFFVRFGGRLIIATLAGAITASSALAQPQGGPVKAEHVTARAFADRAGLVPGGRITVAVQLTMDKEWHVYWRYAGGFAGLPTSVKWTAPKGYLVGPTQFPAPVLIVTKEGDKTFVHEGNAAFLTEIEVPENAEVGKSVALKLHADWLVCREACVLGKAEVTLTLPVVSSVKDAPQTHKEFFEDARRAMPLPTNAAKYAKVSGALDRKEVKPGDKVTVTLTVDVEAGHHIQSNKPAQKDFIPTVVFVAPPAGFEMEEVEYPKAKERTDPVLGKLSEYDGKVEFKIPLTSDPETDKKPRWIHGVVRYQACNDKGTCYPAQNVAFVIPVRMEGGPAPTTPDDDERIVMTGHEEEGLAQGAGSGASDAASESGSAAGSASGISVPADPPGTTASAGSGGQDILSRFQAWLFSFGLIGVIVAGFLGGFVLNLMPCVLPVISLKVLSFVRQAHEHRMRIFLLGLTYAAGIMTFYLVLAALFFKFGQGWGAFFQNPHVVIGMAAVVMAFALSLFGVFAVFTPRVINELGQKAEGEGFASAFGTGVLATLLGTACTAPFLSAAIGYASRLGPTQGTVIFLSVGFGMAFPFIVLAAHPAWVRFIPRPGPWMGTFEAIMGFLLIGTVIWLLNPLRNQIGDYGLLLTLIFLLSVAMAVWIKGKIEFGAPVGRKVKLYATALAILVVGWMMPFRLMSTISGLVEEQSKKEDLLVIGEKAADSGTLIAGSKRDVWRDGTKGIPWQHYRRADALADVRSGYTVFIDYTADWCASCKTNLKTSIERDEVIRVMRDLKIVPYVADYTREKPEIKQDLTRFKRAGVPLYLVYRPGEPDKPEVLPEVLTPGLVIEALRRAGPSKPSAESSEIAQGPVNKKTP